MVDRAVQSGTVTVLLFRAVSHAEFADVTNHGIFRAGPNSYATGKFFAEAGGDALQWGAALEGSEISGFWGWSFRRWSQTSLCGSIGLIISVRLGLPDSTS